mmetsp:Transcript_2733/g.8013  ORF Transcript_2733/g.8013 Transcript_2733/m.8013 type:complete len:423 (-) Transcript_2733:103-1371(-)
MPAARPRTGAPRRRAGTACSPRGCRRRARAGGRGPRRTSPTPARRAGRSGPTVLFLPPGGCSPPRWRRRCAATYSSGPRRGASLSRLGRAGRPDARRGHPRGAARGRVAAHDEAVVGDAHRVREFRLLEQAAAREGVVPEPAPLVRQVDGRPGHLGEAHGLAPVAARPLDGVRPPVGREEHRDLVVVRVLQALALAAELLRVDDVGHGHHAVQDRAALGPLPGRRRAAADPGGVHLEGAEEAPVHDLLQRGEAHRPSHARVRRRVAEDVVRARSPPEPAAPGEVAEHGGDARAVLLHVAPDLGQREVRRHEEDLGLARVLGAPRVRQQRAVRPQLRRLLGEVVASGPPVAVEERRRDGVERAARVNVKFVVPDRGRDARSLGRVGLVVLVVRRAVELPQVSTSACGPQEQRGGAGQHGFRVI